MPQAALRSDAQQRSRHVHVAQALMPRACRERPRRRDARRPCFARQRIHSPPAIAGDCRPQIYFAAAEAVATPSACADIAAALPAGDRLRQATIAEASILTAAPSTSIASRE